MLQEKSNCAVIFVHYRCISNKWACFLCTDVTAKTILARTTTDLINTIQYLCTLDSSTGIEGFIKA